MSGWSWLVTFKNKFLGEVATKSVGDFVVCSRLALVVKFVVVVVVVPVVVFVVVDNAFVSSVSNSGEASMIGKGVSVKIDDSNSLTEIDCCSSSIIAVDILVGSVVVVVIIIVAVIFITWRSEDGSFVRENDGQRAILFAGEYEASFFNSLVSSSSNGFIISSFPDKIEVE